MRTWSLPRERLFSRNLRSLILYKIDHWCWADIILWKGRGGGLVVSMLAFYSDEQSSNPAEAYCFYYYKPKRTKINIKKVGIGPLFSKNKYSFGVRRLLFLDSSSRSDLSLSVAAKPFKMMIIIITSRERHSQLQEKNSEVVITVKCFTAAAARSTTTLSLSLCRQFVKNRFFYSDSLRP